MEKRRTNTLGRQGRKTSITPRRRREHRLLLPREGRQKHLYVPLGREHINLHSPLGGEREKKTLIAHFVRLPCPQGECECLFSLSSTQVAVENLKSYYCHWSLRAMVPTSSSPGFEGSNAVLPSGERYSPIIVPPGGQRGRSSFSSRGRTDRVFLPCSRGE